MTKIKDLIRKNGPGNHSMKVSNNNKKHFRNAYDTDQEDPPLSFEFIYKKYHREVRHNIFNIIQICLRNISFCLSLEGNCRKYSNLFFRGLNASLARQVEATARETALDIGSHVNAAGGMEKSLSTRGKLAPMASVEARSRQEG